jgi:hypothetical protein
VPVPTDIGDLSTTAASNSPSGSDQRSQADDYLRAHAAIIKQLETDLAADSTGIGFLQSGTGATLRTAQNKMRDFVSVKDFGATGDGVANDTAEIQAAIDAHDTVYFPPGTYLISAKLTCSPSTNIIGANQHTVTITASHSGVILEFPIGTLDPIVENITFAGSDTTGIAVASTAGALQGYLIRPLIRNCNFSYEMSFGIDADLIYGSIDRCNFGYDGTVGDKPDPGDSGMVGLRSVFYAATTNYTNLNRVTDCIFNCGDDTNPAVKLTSGNVWKFNRCDFSFGGLAVDSRDVGLLEFDHCWFEGNVNASGALIRVDGGSDSTKTSFRYCNFATNEVNRIWQIATSLPNYLDINNCIIAKETGGYCLYDNSTTVRTLTGIGCVSFWNNTVTGDDVSDKLATEVDFRGGHGSVRFWAHYDTTGSGTKLACSDANAVFTLNSTGDVTINTISNPLGSANNKVRVHVSPQTATECRVNSVTTTSFRVQGFTSAGAAADGVLSVVVYGS